MTATSCECRFADSSHLASATCAPPPPATAQHHRHSPANASLFMSFVDLMIRAHCAIADPCARAAEPQRHHAGPFDFVVVGGGVAGAVVAGRLSEEAGWRVLLLEAGPEEPTTSSVPAFATSAVGTRLDWRFLTEPAVAGEGACRADAGVCRWPRGRMLGGTGAMTGMMYTRGHRKIYDDWARDGCTGWSYEEVLPYFIKSENNKNPELVDDGYHGTSGPLTVQRFGDRPPMADDVLAAAAALGWRAGGDLNGRNQTGFAIAQAMVEGGLRASTARAYLRANHRRPNLVVRINSQATRVLVDRTTGRATAVEYVDHAGARRTVFATKEVILCAGAVGSPHLLLLSGVGPREALRLHGVPLVRHLPGVGRNLHNHVATGVRFYVDDDDVRTLNMAALARFLETRDGPMASTGLTQVTGFIQSSYSDIPDIQIFFDGYSATCSETGKEDECPRGDPDARSCGRRRLTVRPTNVLPRSVGHLTLRGRDPLAPPLIYPEYLSRRVDVDVLVEGLEFVTRLARAPPLIRWGLDLDRSPVAGCAHLPFGSRPYWECLVREETGPENHQAGTCRMGAVGDRRAVVDPELRVHGVTNLRVADASVFPLVPNGNPVSAVVMVAEKAADMIRAAWRR